ncbi:MAG: alpha-glucuronidase [Ruminococcus sp.]|uniref:alpha-glucuronidase n=1 Tax=Ruminococcus sp. TaxID=41978 RepID=UPI0025CDA0D1|nr:alpha-glucuronidase [Ruminococcus sp.]MBR0529840.1 alpha-glucuronidase [Ruminococcus sp.]
MVFSKLWLNYKKLDDTRKRILISCEHSLKDSAAFEELQTAMKAMLPEAIVLWKSEVFDDDSYLIVLGIHPELDREEYTIAASLNITEICGGSEAGLLYGVFEFLKRTALAGGFIGFNAQAKPSQPLRMLDHWDNADGSIERGYSGKSFFFKDGELLVNERTVMYARLMASVGINGVVINNVNVRGSAKRLLTKDYADSLEELGELFGRYGIKLFICPDFAAPISVGGLDSADPLDERVINWWKECCASLFSRIPNLGGFLVKADSEGQPGPFAYGRDHADGANMLARAVAPFGGLVIWRCFVYNCAQDWRDLKTDRARSGYDNFMPLDGRFDDNVILQVKNGPMDFQVREPVHPLFGAMKHTKLMAEFQLAQEYTGQQKHVCWLVPMIKDILGFHTKHDMQDDRVSRTVCGVAAVANTGDDFCWTGSELAAANLYGYGRLLFNEDTDLDELAEEWAQLTFGDDEQVISAVSEILKGSHKAYEDYTVPLGLGWMCKPNHHYGPDPWGYEFDRWGTYNRADRNGIGVDRSPAGTGYSAQYAPDWAEVYGDIDRCPDDLLLFFHRVPYTHKLRGGKTVIQHIYDTHFEGYEQAEHFAALWASLKGRVDERTFKNVSERFEEQLNCAKEWRDIINTFFHRLSGIDDKQGRKIYN